MSRVIKPAAATFVLLLMLGVVPAGLPQTPKPAEGDKGKTRTDRHGDALPDGAVARLGTVRFRTTATEFVVAADGKSLLTVSGGRTLGRWDADTGRVLGETHLPGPFASDAWLSSDGRTLAVVEDEKLALWNAADGKRLRTLPVWPLHVTFAPDGKSLVTAESGIRGGPDHIRLWDLATGKDRQLAETPSYANDLAFDAKGERLFAAVDNHSLRCWDVASGKQLWQNDHAASHVLVSPDGKTLCADTYNGGPLHLFDAGSGDKTATLGEGRAWTTQLAFAPNGGAVAQATPDAVFVWDVESRKLRHRLDGRMRVAFAPDGKSLFTLDKLLRRWDATTGKLTYPDTSADGHVGAVLGVGFAPDGRSLASCGADGDVRLWDVAGKRSRVLRSDAPPGGGLTVGGFFVATLAPVQFTPDGRLLLSEAADGTLVLTDVETGKAVRRFRFPAPLDGATTPARARLTSDGRRVLALGTTTTAPRSSIDLDRKEPVLGWDVATGLEVLSSRVTLSSAYGASFAPDGSMLALGDAVLALGAGESVPLPRFKLEGLGAPSGWSPDGRFLAAAETAQIGEPGKAIHVIESITGRELTRLEAPLGHNREAVFSPDGRLVAASGADALFVWETTAGKRVLHLPAEGRLTQWTPAGFATCLAIAPDGRTLATGHADGTILLWDLSEAGKRPTLKAEDVDAAACWADLAAEEPAKAYAAVERLASAPAAAVALLRKHLEPVKVDSRWLAARLADLDSDDFATRQAATRELKKVGEAVEGELRRELKRTTSPEVVRRLQDVLETVERARREDSPSEEVRRLRAVTALEWATTEEARSLLRELAGGAADARLTRAARAALERLEKH